MNVAEQLVNQLLDAGVRRIYGIVGDSLNPVVDAVRKTGGSAKGGIDWVHVRLDESSTIPLSLQDPLATADPRVDALIAQIDSQSPTIPA